MEMLVNSLWVALFSAALAVLFTSPIQGILLSVSCGVAGRLVRDFLALAGVGQGWATILAAAAVAVIAAAEVRGRRIAPVAMICGVFPLGASHSVFETIIGLLRVSSLEGDELRQAAVELVANAGRAFTITLAIAVGLAAGIAVVHAAERLAVRRD